MKIRYRFLTGIIFALVAIITPPLQQIFSFIFLGRGEITLLQLFNLAGAGSLFAIPAFLWGGILTSRFTMGINRETPPNLLSCFFWGVLITVLIILSLSLFIGLIGSPTFTGFLSKCIGGTLLTLMYVSVSTFGLIYAVGGSAGMIACIHFRRTTHNQQRNTDSGANAPTLVR
jgi:hypothetical protein